jgi:methyl-accepting chemotaxis protein
MIKFKTISSRFIFFSVISVTISVLVTGITGYLIVRASILHKLKTKDLIVIATSKADKITSKIQRAIETSTLIANDPLILEWFASRESNPAYRILVQKKLDSIVATSPEYTNSFAANNLTGNYWRNNETLALKLNESDENNSWFYDAMRKKVKTQLNINTDSKENSFVFINIIMGELENPKGIAGVSLNFTDVAKEFKESDPDLDSKIWLIDKSGKIKISSIKDELNDSIGSVTNLEIESSILGNHSKTEILEYDSKNKIHYDIVYLPLSFENYSVLYQIPRKNTTAILKPIAYGTIIICSFSIIIIFFLFFYGTKNITKPIRKTILGLNQITKGNLKQKIEIISEDEIADLGLKFNEFTEKILLIIKSVKVNSKLVFDSSKILKIQTGEFSRNASSQASTLEEIAATINHVFLNSEAVKESTELQTKNLFQLGSKLQDLSTEIESMNEVVISSLNNIKKISVDVTSENESISAVNMSMKEIHSSSREMYSIIEVIHDISEKTNLLALNASIEAARAGASGRGFAVVAFEISKLADKTAESVKSIDLIIRKNNREINSGIGYLETVSKKTEIITKDIDKIVLGMNDMFTIMQKQIIIKQSTQKESETVQKESNDIKLTIAELSNSLQEIKIAIDSIQNVASSNLNGSYLIAENSTKLTDISLSLNEKVDFFKTD